jgi:hypothetical protein
MAFLWPPTLPQVPQKGYSESVGIYVVRSQTDLGPAKQRVRGKKPSELNLSFIMTTEQTEDLEDFVKNIIRGVSRFQFTHPRTLLPVDVRIISNNGEFYQLQYLAPGYWTTNLKFEVLP